MSGVVCRAGCWDCNAFRIGWAGRRLRDGEAEHFGALTSADHSSAVADHMALTGGRMKWDLFDILAAGRSDVHCGIEEGLIRDLQPALNENVGSEKLFAY